MFEKYLKRIDPKDLQKGNVNADCIIDASTVNIDMVTIVTLANAQLTQHDIGKFSRKKGKTRTSSNTER